jgi:hypothetical protein
MTEKGKRRPTPDDVAPFMELVGEGKSLRAACASLGIDPGSMHRFIDDDKERSAEYERAKERRAEYFQELGLELSLASATGAEVGGQKIDPKGARAALEAIKWAASKMAPRTHGDKLALAHEGNAGFVVTMKQYGPPETS